MPPSRARFLRDRRGVAAVEFALILPILMVLALGIVEVGSYALLCLKLDHAAGTMADLASRDEELSAATLASLFDAVGPIVAPYSLADDGCVIVSAVGADGGAAPVVAWQRRGAGTLAAASAVGIAGGRATLPAAMIVRDGDTVIVAEVVFSYRAQLLELVPSRTLRRAAYFRPRLGTLRTLGSASGPPQNSMPS